MSQRYSRLESVEERNNFRSAIILTILAITVVIVLIIAGIPTVGKVATFVSGLRGGNTPITLNDKTPPAPPAFRTFPDFTNQGTTSISGTGEPGSTVKLMFNGKEQDTLVDKDGNFSFQNLTLVNGDNTFFAFAVDSAGNTSQKSADKKITYDNKPPGLSIDSPPDGSKFFGSGQRQVTIQGTTDSGANVTVNDRIVSVDDSGKFQYTLTLSNGDNKFTIKSLDPAGNSTEKDITLNFSE
jgi:hypothetical protein